MLPHPLSVASCSAAWAIVLTRQPSGEPTLRKAASRESVSPIGSVGSGVPLFSFATAVIKLRSSRLLDVRKMLLSAPAFEWPNPGRERKRRESLVVSARARNGGRDFIKMGAGLVDNIHGTEICPLLMNYSGLAMLLAILPGSDAVEYIEAKKRRYYLKAGDSSTWHKCCVE